MKLKNNKLKLKNKILTSYKIDVSNYFIFDINNDWAVIEDLGTNKKGWIYKDYNKIINPIFDSCWRFQDGFALFNKNEKEGWVNSEGKILSEGFDECYYFQGDFARFERNEKYGWIDKTGKIIGEGFDSCYDFEKGFGRFKKNDKYGWIDKDGNIYTEQPY